MPNIFITYRREDSAKEANILYKKMTEKFGDENVFLDVHSSPLGQYFLELLREWVYWADVILVLIGEKWRGITDSEDIFRIFRSNDYVRAELQFSLHRNITEEIPVIPVLLNDVDFLAWNLPDDISRLKSLTWHNLDFSNFQHGCDLLIRRMIREVSESKKKTPGKPLLINHKIIPLERLLDYDPVAMANPNYALVRQVSSHPLPSDASIYLDKGKYGWTIDIKCENGLYDGRTQMRPSIDYMKDWQIEEVVGELMDYYLIKRRQIYLFKKLFKSKSILKNVKEFFSGSEEEGEWVPYYGNARFSDLHKLLIEFNDIAYSGPLCVVNEFFPNADIILGAYNYLGTFPEGAKKFFGEYICSLTTDLGGRDVVSKKLFSYPTVPNTSLQYFNIYKLPRLVGVNCYGHVGRNEKGYHVIFAW